MRLDAVHRLHIIPVVSQFHCIDKEETVLICACGSVLIPSSHHAIEFGWAMEKFYSWHSYD